MVTPYIQDTVQEGRKEGGLQCAHGGRGGGGGGLTEAKASIGG